MGVPVFEYDGFEADDLIGTLSKQATEQGIKTLILTGDADQLQLVDEDTSLLMYTGFGEMRTYDPAGVAEKYDGLGPEYVAEIKALEGDSSDNIPGVPGVGKKSARAVLTKLGHFPSLFERLPEIENIEGLRGAKRTMNLLDEHRETAASALVLTTIVRDVPVEFSADDSKFGDFDREAVIKILMNYELQLIANRLPKMESAPEIEAAPGWEAGPSDTVGPEAHGDQRRFDGGKNHGQIFRFAAGDDRVDSDFFDRARRQVGWDRTDDFAGRPGGADQHAQNPDFGRRHDRQPVAPATLETRFDVVF